MSASVFPIILCLISAITVAATNLFVKKGGDVLSTRMIVSIAMALSVLPFVPFVDMPTREIWWALGLSVCRRALVLSVRDDTGAAPRRFISGVSSDARAGTSTDGDYGDVLFGRDAWDFRLDWVGDRDVRVDYFRDARGGRA